MSYGTHFTAWIPIGDQAVSGVIIPHSAVVWHLGQALVFVKTSAQEYSRKVLIDYQLFDHDYFVRDVLQPGDEVVINGAQTLLSQQLKSLIPNEDKDD